MNVSLLRAGASKFVSIRKEDSHAHAVQGILSWDRDLKYVYVSELPIYNVVNNGR